MVDQELSSWTRRALSAEPLSSVVVIRPGMVIRCSVQNLCGLDGGRKLRERRTQKPSVSHLYVRILLNVHLINILEALRLRLSSLHKVGTLRRL